MLRRSRSPESTKTTSSSRWLGASAVRVDRAARERRGWREHLLPRHSCSVKFQLPRSHGALRLIDRISTSRTAHVDEALFYIRWSLLAKRSFFNVRGSETRRKTIQARAPVRALKSPEFPAVPLIDDAAGT